MHLGNVARRDVLLEVESARSIAYWASWVGAEGRPELALAASVKVDGFEKVKASIDDMVLIHGFISI